MLPGRAQEAAALSISPSALSLLLWSGAGWGRAEGSAGCSVSFWLEDSTGEGCVLLPLALVVAVLWGEAACWPQGQRAVGMLSCMHGVQAGLAESSPRVGGLS